jgi:hypothetical protein
MRAYCIWCESNPNSNPCRPKDGMAWIHLSCFMDMHNAVREYEKVKEQLKGGESYEEIARFLKRMEDHHRRWNGSMRLLGKLTGDPNYQHSIIGRDIAQNETTMKKEK